MTKHIDDGGPLFPQSNRETDYGMDQNGYSVARPYTAQRGGASLRDWFAGQAMQSCLTACANDSRESGTSYCEHVARVSYEMADAMIKARKP